MEDRQAFRTRVRKRLIKAISELHPEVEVVRARAWTARDERVDGRWAADERSQGKGTHDAFIVILKRRDP